MGVTGENREGPQGDPPRGPQGAKKAKNGQIDQNADFFTRIIVDLRTVCGLIGESNDSIN